MNIVSPLFPSLTGKNMLFSCVYKQNIFPPEQDLFWRAQKQQRQQKYFIICRLYYNCTAQKNNCLRFLINKLITKSL